MYKLATRQKIAGLLISTTDLRLAKKLNKYMTVESILNGSIGHYEYTHDGTVIIYARREMYELKLY